LHDVQAPVFLLKPLQRSDTSAHTRLFKYCLGPQVGRGFATHCPFLKSKAILSAQLRQEPSN